MILLLCCIWLSLLTPMVSCSASNFTSSFPFRVLLVDNDGIHLSTVEQILLSSGYEVTKFHSPKAALVALQRNKYRFDAVVCGVSMSDIDGLRLLRTAGLELDMPVVLITSDSSHEIAFQGILNGACECLAKPVQPETLKLIWQHVVSKRRNDFSSLGSAHIQGSVGINPGGVLPEISCPADEVGAAAPRGGGPSCANSKASKKRGEEGGEGSDHQDTTSKKPRLIWTDELHQIFVDAIKSLTIEKAVPKKILEYMRNNGVPNINRENVASHLQKYRLYLRKSEHNEVDKSSKFPSQSVSLNVTKESSFIPPELDQLEPLGQALEEYNKFSSDFCHMNELHPPILSHQFSNIDANVAPLHSNDVLNDYLYLNIWKDYEETYKSQNFENYLQVYYEPNLHVSNNRSSPHSIGDDYFINVTDVNSRSTTQDDLKQTLLGNLPDNSYVMEQKLGSHH